MADYLNQPGKSSKSIETVRLLPQVVNVLQAESQGSVFLQLVDVLLGAKAFNLSRGQNPYRSEIAAEVEKLFKNKKSGCKPSLCRSESRDGHPFDSERKCIIGCKRCQDQPLAESQDLSVGAEIATADGFEKIVKIEKLPAEQVYDIEVEGTHNFVGNGIVAHNTSGILMRAGASLQLSSSATSTTADIELAAADRIDLFAGSLSLQTSSQTAGELKLMSKGSLILDTSGAAGGGAPILLQAGSGNINLSSTGTITLTGNTSLNNGTLRLNGLTYTFPGSDTTNGVLISNGSGILAWNTIGQSNVTADSLDFAEFQDSLDLDADTSINGPYSFIVRAGNAARQNATSGNNDLQLAAEDAIIVDADDFTLTTSNTGVSSLQLMSKGVLRLDTSTNNNNILLLPGTGNVGIGTTGPGGNLEIYGTDNTPRLFINGPNDGTANSNQKIQFYQAGVLQAMVGIAGGVELITPGTVAGDLVLRGDTQKILFTTDGGTTSAMTISTTGNVGIGTTAPGSNRLSVIGGDIYTTSNIVSNGGTVRSDTFADAGGNLNWATLSSGVLTFNTGSSDDMIFKVNAGGTEAMRILGSSGNVGIGTTGPLGLLDTYGDKSILLRAGTGAISISGSSGGAG